MKRIYWVLLAILTIQGTVTVLAMRRNSTTFDEIAMIAGGARGYETGNWNIALGVPPVTLYTYGLLPYLSGVKYPDETGVTTAQQGEMWYRYRYAQVFFWGLGNDPERLAFLGRLPAALCALLLTLLAFFFTRRYYGDTAGAFAATIVAFLPDVLAHGGVAYNDIAIAPAFFAAMWLLDGLVRRPTLGRAVLAGLAVALAMGIKNSAIGLALLAAVLLVAEAVGRRDDRAWRTQMLLAVVLTALTTYLGLVLLYRGDFKLAEYQYALSAVFQQVALTTAPAYLLGRISTDGLWYYFPVVFLLKTSAALHLLIALALAYYLGRLPSARQLFASPLRAPLLALLVFGLMLARSQLHIGFRHALPILPLLAVMIAPALASIVKENWRRLRPVVAVLLAWLVLHPLSYYPNFLAYVSEYGPGRDRGYKVLADSNLDWGQGLLQLRDYMRARGIERVYLSYFGSAWPSGYGIDYEPLLSFYLLPPRTKPAAAQPRYIAVSATNLAGAYFKNDPFKEFRNREPDAVIAHTIYLYRVNE